MPFAGILAERHTQQQSSGEVEFRHRGAWGGNGGPCFRGPVGESRAIARIGQLLGPHRVEVLLRQRPRCLSFRDVGSQFGEANVTRSQSEVRFRCILGEGVRRVAV